MPLRPEFPLFRWRPIPSPGRPPILWILDSQPIVFTWRPLVFSIPTATASFTATAIPQLTLSLAVPFGNFLLNQGDLPIWWWRASVTAPVSLTGSFTATADPLASFIPFAPFEGSFTATADPLATIIGNIGDLLFVATADPTAVITGSSYDGTGSFVATAYPTSVWTGFSNALPGSFLATASPVLHVFPLLGQPEGCASGDGVPDGEAGGSSPLCF
jgi:hypothetical protein